MKNKKIGNLLKEEEKYYSLILTMKIKSTLNFEKVLDTESLPLILHEMVYTTDIINLPGYDFIA